MGDSGILDVVKDLLSIVALLCGAVFATGGAWALVRRGLSDVDKTKKDLEQLTEKHSSLAKELRERCCQAEVSLARVEGIHVEVQLLRVELTTLAKDHAVLVRQHEGDSKTLTVLLNQAVPVLRDTSTICKLNK